MFVSFETWAERFVVSRIDVAENTRKMYRSHLRGSGRRSGSRPALDHRRRCGRVGRRARPRSASRERWRSTSTASSCCWTSSAIEPNPARDPRVKLPKRITEEANPPSDEHFLAMIETLLPRWRLFFLTIEQGGLRIGEAAALRWGDVDVAGGRLRLPRSATKTNTSRWVQLPGVAHGGHRGHLPARGSRGRASRSSRG